VINRELRKWLARGLSSYFGENAVQIGNVVDVTPTEDQKKAAQVRVLADSKDDEGTLNRGSDEDRGDREADRVRAKERKKSDDSPNSGGKAADKKQENLTGKAKPQHSSAEKPTEEEDHQRHPPAEPVKPPRNRIFRAFLDLKTVASPDVATRFHGVHEIGELRRLDKECMDGEDVFHVRSAARASFEHTTDPCTKALSAHATVTTTESVSPGEDDADAKMVLKKKLSTVDLGSTILVPILENRRKTS